MNIQFALLVILIATVLWAQTGCGSPKSVELSPIPIEKNENLFSRGFLRRDLVFTGLAFHGGTLFAGSDLGLYAIRDRKAIFRLEWTDRGNVIEEPFFDKVNNNLWLRHTQLGSLVYFDGVRWQSEPVPRVSATRGDALRGYTMFTSRSALFIHSSTGLWTWSRSKSNWEYIELPSQNCTGNEPGKPPRCFVAAAASNDAVYAVIRVGMIGTMKAFIPKEATEEVSDRIFRRNGDSWTELPNPTARFFLMKQIVGGAEAAFILSHHGELFEIAEDQINRVIPPAPVEYISSTSAGNLLVSLKDGSIFELEGDWVRRSDPISRTTTQSTIVHLVESNGVIAYSVSNNRAGIPEECSLGGSAIWIVENGKAACVSEE